VAFSTASGSSYGTRSFSFGVEGKRIIDRREKIR
jgi:hypothetical protein